MVDLSDVTVGDLHRALDSVESKTPALRLLAAIGYKHGLTQTELAALFDVERKTIYNWLTRIRGKDPGTAVRDASRSGRPRKLAQDRLDGLVEALRSPPRSAGVPAPAWTTAMVQDYVRDQFDVEYTRASCRRLLRGAGLESMPASKAVNEIDWSVDAADLREQVRVWVPT